MATINLGRIKPVFQGAYKASTAYVVDDIVTFGGESFICILASTGNATSNATYWSKIAKKGDDVTQLTTHGDFLFRDATGVQRLAAGTSGQVLQTKGAGYDPIWADATSINWSTKTANFTDTGGKLYTPEWKGELQITKTDGKDDLETRFETKEQEDIFKNSFFMRAGLTFSVDNGDLKVELN